MSSATNGMFIAIEGGDGSGKATQAALLKERLEKENKRVHPISFPQYGDPSARLVERYLNGEFGAIGTQAPELLSLAYAIDRYAAKQRISEWLESGAYVVADRYIASNLAHQGALKDGDQNARKELYDQILYVEYELLGIPRPGINIVLSVPAAVSQANIDKKVARSYTTKKRDLHEIDTTHLEKAKANFTELCDLYPEEYIRIDCMDGEVMRSKEAVAAEIYAAVRSVG